MKKQANCSVFVIIELQGNIKKPEEIRHSFISVFFFLTQIQP